MTKGGSSKPKILGRLIFGEKRKQHSSPTRHRSATRNGGSTADVSSFGGGGAGNKSPINVHDWAVWRMQLNEQMGNGITERSDLKQMKQFLHSNQFYQQHSRDSSNGRYNGVRLLFSIPHAKFKPELTDPSRVPNRNTNMEVGDMATYDQNNVRANNDDRTTTTANLVSPGSTRVIDKTISQLLPKSLIGNTAGFLHINEQMVATDAARTRHSIRTSYTASDRVHSTLQKAVKDGNVLEKIKAFEMQAAAAAQAETTTKLGGGGGGGGGNVINNRMQPVTSPIQSAAHRTLSPTITHPISPLPIQHEPQHQYIRSHRGRYIHPAQYHRDGNLGPIVGRESRKGAHVLEPAHGDIILKRRTPSQKNINDEDYSMTVMSSMALTTSQGHHRPHHYHHRSSASRSRHRQEAIHDKRTSNHNENGQKKNQQKQKETPSSSSTKPSTRRRWLKGRKETPTENATESVKQDVSTTKSNKNNKNKKKNTEQDKLESTKKTTSPIPKGKTSSTSDNNRVYGVPNTTVNEQTESEAISPQPPSRIDEENESDQEEKTIENKHNHISSKKEDFTQNKECDTIVPATIERRPSKTKHHQRLSSTDGEILSRVDDDTRFSRPTDDHAHHSELNDEDDECKSEGDVFIEESSATNITSHHQQPSNTIRRYLSQCSADEISSDRRWQWSKESGGLIDKGNRKKKQQPPITIVTRKNKINQEEEQPVYETPQSEQIPIPIYNTHILKKKQSFTTINGSNNELNNSKQISNTIMNSMNNDQEQITTDNFFENGPHTNPEETIPNITSSA